MTSFYARASPSDDDGFEASGTHYGSTFELTGKCSRTRNGSPRVTFTIQYSQDEFRTKYFDGHLMPDGSIAGYQGWHEDTQRYSFFLRRASAEIICHRPSPLEFRTNRIQALWRFVRSWALNEARKRLWSWEYFKQRRAYRIRQIQYDIRNYTPYGRPLDESEDEDWAVVRQGFTAADALMYRRMRDDILRFMPCHP